MHPAARSARTASAWGRRAFSTAGTARREQSHTHQNFTSPLPPAPCRPPAVCLAVDNTTGERVRGRCLLHATGWCQLGRQACTRSRRSKHLFTVERAEDRLAASAASICPLAVGALPANLAHASFLPGGAQARRRRAAVAGPHRSGAPKPSFTPPLRLVPALLPGGAEARRRRAAVPGPHQAGAPRDLHPAPPAPPQPDCPARRVCAALRHRAVPPDQGQAGQPVGGE